MPMFPPRLIPTLAYAILACGFAGGLATGCQEDPDPKLDGRSSQVPAKNTPSAVAPASAAATAPATATVSASATVTVSAPASASASGASKTVEAPVAPPDPPLDCDVLIEPADIAAACG